MDTKELADGIMKVINNLPEENRKEVEKMIEEIDERMDMDKHTLKDIILFIESILVSLSFTVYLATYMKKQEQENGH